MDGESAPEAAQKLGINPNRWYRWKQKPLKSLEPAAGSGLGSSPQEMAAEMDALRKRRSKAERINEILKKRGAILPGTSDEVSVDCKERDETFLERFVRGFGSGWCRVLSVEKRTFFKAS